MAGLEGIYRMAKLTCIWALSWKVRAWGSLSEKCPFGCFYPFQSSAEGRSSSELRTFRTAWGGEGWESVILAVLSVESPRSGYRAIHDFTVQRGRSPLWISNPPRYHGSAWKVMLCISNHPRYHGSAWKVTALNIEPSTISRFSAAGPRPEAVTKRAERAIGGARAACFEQPEDVYSGCVDARPAKYTSSYSASTRPRHEA